MSELIRYIVPVPSPRLLCIQYGPGVISVELAKLGFDVTTADHCPEIIEEVDLFDTVLAVMVICASPEPQKTLSAIARAIKPGGMAVTLDPSLEMRSERVLAFATRNSLIGQDFKTFLAWTNAAQVTQRFCRSDLERLHSKAGLEFIEVSEKMDRMLLACKSRKELPVG